MPFVHKVEIEIDDVPAEVAAHAIATDQPIDLEVVLPEEPGEACTIRLSLAIEKAHPTGAAAMPFASQFDGDWHWSEVGTLGETNEVAQAFARDQEARYPGLAITGP